MFNCHVMGLTPSWEYEPRYRIEWSESLNVYVAWDIYNELPSFRHEDRGEINKLVGEAITENNKTFFSPEDLERYSNW